LVKQKKQKYCVDATDDDDDETGDDGSLSVAAIWSS